MGDFSDIFLFPERIKKKEPNQRMKFRKTNKVGKFEVKKVKNKGAVGKNVVRVAISPRSPIKPIENRKRDCALGCAQGINTT